MDTLKSLTDDTNMVDRLNGEFKVTMPSQDEAIIMFDENQMKDKLWKMLLDSKKPVTESDMLEMFKKDIVIAAIKKEIRGQAASGSG
jgi:hypothetical protein